MSLLPSATEIVADFGLAGDLVGRSHECQWPEEVREVPVVSASRIDPAAWDSRQIDAAVRAAVEGGEALYAADAEMLASLRLCRGGRRPCSGGCSRDFGRAADLGGGGGVGAISRAGVGRGREGRVLGG